MHTPPIHELGALGGLFIVFFVLAWMLQRWRIPALLGFMLAGFLMQSYTPRLIEPVLPIVGEVAVWLLFFFVGLEYSPENLAKLSRSIARPGLIDFGINFGGVTAVALLFSSPVQAVLMGSAMYPSSTAIVARLLLDYGRLASAEAELLLGLLIFEDIVGVALLGFLTPLSQGGELSYVLLLRIGGALLGTFATFWILYKWLLPWALRRLPPLNEEPLTVFLTFGLVMAVGALGHEVGLSGALTAFLLGVLVPEGSALYHAAEKFLAPIRELSVGLFFFALCYFVEVDRLPFALGIGWLLLALVLKGLSTYWAARVWGLKPKTALRAALSFLPKGEFSLLFGVLTEVWRSLILLLVLGTSVVGTLAFALAESLTARLFPKKAPARPIQRPI